MNSIPRVDQKGQELYAIKGLPPSLLRMPAGLPVPPPVPPRPGHLPSDHPELREVAPQRWSRCHFAEEVLNG